MKMRMGGIVFAAMMAAGIAAGADAAQTSTQSPFVGVWRGQVDHLPGVDLVITDEGGILHGGILFYFHTRTDVNASYTSTPGLPEPMFDLKEDGHTLKFEVSHRRAHPPRTLHDPPMTFQLNLTGTDRAELMNETEGDGPAVVLIRSNY
jgi:hypothetical protein